MHWLARPVRRQPSCLVRRPWSSMLFVGRDRRCVWPRLRPVRFFRGHLPCRQVDVSDLAFWQDYVRLYGIPSDIYTDFDAVYYDHEKKQKLTQYGRALRALNVRCVYAHSPQAKGRVERANRTLQDRLLRALRERLISTIKEANRFLDEYFVDDFNRRFASTDSLTDIHRSASGIDLANIFCFEETRSVYNDWTISWKSQFLQLLPSVVPLPPPRAKVVIRILLDGSFHILWNEHEISFDPLKSKPRTKKERNLPQPPGHPWRHKPVGKLRSKPKSFALDPWIG